MSKELIQRAEQIKNESRVGANTANRVGGVLADMANEVNGLLDNVLDWINHEKPQGGGYILTQSDVVNALTDISELKPLSAKQGMVLKAILDALVVDNLTTNDGAKALSAKQGKKLADGLNGHTHDGVYQPAGSYADSEHMHVAAQVTEQVNKRFMTDAERSTLSSLGANYAKADFSNVTTQNLGKNGYCKFPNGLLIQWGDATKTVGPSWMQKVYLPIYFYDVNYTMMTTTISSGNIVVVKMISAKEVSSFTISSQQPEGGAGEAWNWLAIGRWK